MHISRKHFLAFFIGTLVFLMASALQAQDSAASAVSVRGLVTATDSNGAVRQLKRGDLVFAGDTIETGRRSRVRLAFTDGSTSAILDRTTFVIEDYSFSGTEDGTESSVLNLLNGTLEFVSGLIGKNNRNAFRLESPLATIGLRGTTLKLTVIIPEDPSEPPIVRASTLEGEISFTAEIIPEVVIPETETTTETTTETATETTTQEVIIPAGESAEVTGATTDTTTTVTTTNTVTVPLETIEVDGTENEDAVEENYQPEVVTPEDQERAVTTETELEQQETTEETTTETTTEAEEVTEETTEETSTTEESASVPDSELLPEIVEELGLTEEQVDQLVEELEEITGEEIVSQSEITSDPSNL